VSAQARGTLIAMAEIADHSDLSIVIPAYNEEDGLPKTLASLTALLPGAEIIVVDDASTDATVAAARDFPQVTFVSHTFNRGYGGGLKTGMRLASREYVAWFDADNEHRAEDLLAMVTTIRAGRLVAVIAQRERSGPSPFRNWGKFVIRMLARSFNVHAGKDINCGLRVFRRDVICRYLAILPDTFSASITSTMIMVERGYPVRFHPVTLNPRIGHSKVRIGDGFMALMLVLRMIMLFAPMRIFFRFGLLVLTIGLLYGAIMTSIHRAGWPAGSVLLMLTGVMVSIFGLIADQISQMRLSSYDASSYRLVQAGVQGARASETPVAKRA
jgi:glycosyltransferase involved in cell wall biosynthesis